VINENKADPSIDGGVLPIAPAPPTGSDGVERPPTPRTRRLAVSITVVLLTAACTSTSDTATTSAAEPTTEAPTTLAPGETSVRDIADLQAIADSAGRALIYVSDEEGVTAVVSGEGTNGREIQAGDAFFIGSGSKMITAAAVLTLVDEGLVGLDDLLADYVDFDVATPITIRHLLQHKSGLGDNDSIYDTCDPDEVMEGLAALATSPYNSDPGTRASYSTNGFNMLSLVMSSASGMSAADLVRQNIFEPLGMTSTFFTGAEDGPPLVFGEQSWDDECLAERMDIGTGGGFASSASDLDTFMRALFEDNLLSEASLTQMTTVESSVFNIDYGLGLGVLYPPDGGDQPIDGLGCRRSL
jgi:CubicO group peptidase (beta-lactamase class C family)